MTTECPTCGRDDFKSETGLKIHHQRSHNEPLNGANHFCDSCSSSFTEINGLHRHYNNNPLHKTTGRECPSCNNNYNQLGQHWSKDNECRPNILKENKEILTGILMGDGSVVGKDSGNPSIKIQMNNKEYLEYLSESCGWLFTQNISDSQQKTFTIRTVSHPEISEFADWYSSGEKVFPNDIDLSPTVLKHWFVCDGSKNFSSGESANPRIILYMSNEHKNTDKIDSYFGYVGLPKPSNYVIRERERYYNNETHIACSAQFTVEQSRELWSYMGEPLPGFERKWPNQKG